MLRSNKLLLTRAFSSSSTNGKLKKTAFYDQHIALNGKMVDFAGYELPVLYENKDQGVMKEHIHTRTKASIFDVSHMGQVIIKGSDRIKYLEQLVVGDINGLDDYQSRLSLFTNEKGGIIDDTVITKYLDHLYVVVNGACKDKDLEHMTNHLENNSSELDVTIELLDDFSLLALQGPYAKQVLANIINTNPTPEENLDMIQNTFPFMSSRIFNTNQDDMELRVTRCGYTGEDGFELSVPNENAPKLLDLLLKDPEVKMAGLGARDSLRLEAGLCLYGNDLNEDITPVEGTLLWTISKNRRIDANFIGADVILNQIKDKKSVTKKRVGLVINGPPARDHTEIFDESGENSIGEITSGTFGPTIKKPIAMAYVQKGFTKSGTKVKCKVRNKMVNATVTKMPFVPANYHK